MCSVPKKKDKITIEKDKFPTAAPRTNPAVEEI